MTFCTFETSSLLQVGKVVRQEADSVVYNDDTDLNKIVGIISSSYQDKDTFKFYAEVHMGGGVTYAVLSEDWNGLWSPLSVYLNNIKPALTSESKHGYLIPQLPPQAKTAGELVAIYWRGVI